MQLRPLVLAVLLPAAAACAASRAVPTEIVTLYDVAKPDGVIELEIDRDGRLREAEAQIPIEAVPTELVEIARRMAPGGRVVGAEREFTGGKWGYEVQLDVDGLGMEVVLDEKGNVLETERELRREEAPEAVLRAATAAVPGGDFQSVEAITRGEHVEYHVKTTRDGASYKLIVSPEGRVLRHVREARAEIEIPIE